MVKLNDFNYFAGWHWETGSVCNYYASLGVKAPHTGLPFSEALLLGISGGIVMGYFSFAYKGYDPHVALLTRNTFDPLDTLLSRLGVTQEILQTGNPATGVKNLVETLENGLPAITWVDIFSLPYFPLPNDEGMWLMYPAIVYGYDEAEDRVYIADRAQVPLVVTTAELARARARVKQEKFRVMILGHPDPEKLPAAASKGIWDTIKLFTDQPPKGSRENFGFAAYRRWCSLLANPKLKNSWAAVFPPGQPMLAGLITAFSGTIQNGPGNDGERGVYAAFLEEAAAILKKPALVEAAGLFRRSGRAWQALGEALLPDEIASLGKIRRLMLQRKMLFREQGGEAAQEIARINHQIKELRAEAAENFPIGEKMLPDFYDRLASKIMAVHDLEQEAVGALQGAMTG